MDAMRKQLDVLMGTNRNGDVREVNRKYFDRDVCRLFLAGLCPHDLFQLTVGVLIEEPFPMLALDAQCKQLHDSMRDMMSVQDSVRRRLQSAKTC